MSVFFLVLPRFFPSSDPTHVGASSTGSALFFRDPNGWIPASQYFLNLDSNTDSVIIYMHFEYSAMDMISNIEYPNYIDGFEPF
jgi:hypothetical protein